VGGIWGQTRNLDDRTFDLPDLAKGRSDGPSRLRRRDMGTDTMSGMPIRNVQRETFNSQLSTRCPKGHMVDGIWGQTGCLARLDTGGPIAPEGLGRQLGPRSVNKKFLEVANVSTVLLRLWNCTERHK